MNKAHLLFEPVNLGYFLVSFIFTRWFSFLASKAVASWLRSVGLRLRNANNGFYWWVGTPLKWVIRVNGVCKKQ
jgi:hypothetical protein